MVIVLLKDKMEGGQVKVTHRPNKRKVIGWFAGTEMEVSDATGQKLIEAGEAREVQVAEAEVVA